MSVTVRTTAPVRVLKLLTTAVGTQAEPFHRSPWPELGVGAVTGLPSIAARVVVFDPAGAALEASTAPVVGEMVRDASAAVTEVTPPAEGVANTRSVPFHSMTWPTRGDPSASGLPAIATRVWQVSVDPARSQAQVTAPPPPPARGTAIGCGATSSRTSRLSRMIPTHTPWYTLLGVRPVAVRVTRSPPSAAMGPQGEDPGMTPICLFPTSRFAVCDGVSSGTLMVPHHAVPSGTGSNPAVHVPDASAEAVASSRSRRLSAGSRF